MLYLKKKKKPREPMIKLIQIVRDLAEIAGYKIKIQNSMAFFSKCLDLSEGKAGCSLRVCVGPTDKR